MAVSALGHCLLYIVKYHLCLSSISLVINQDKFDLAKKPECCFHSTAFSVHESNTEKKNMKTHLRNFIKILSFEFLEQKLPNQPGAE